MSTITVFNINDGTTSVPSTYVTNGSAKAWVNFVGAGTISARDSFNVASLTDNGTGDYSVNYTSAMATGNGAVTALSSRDVSLSQVGMFQANVLSGSYFRIMEVGSTFFDPNIVTASLQSELA
jgi:hypothetical protein